MKSSLEDQADGMGKLAPSDEQPENDLPAPLGGSDFIKRLPPAVHALLKKPPLLEHEDEDAYNALQRAVEAAIQPRDLFEFFWARDFTDLTWEIERCRRLRKGLLEEAKVEVLREMFRVRIDHGWVDLGALDAKAKDFAIKWYQNSHYDRRSMLEKFEITEDELTAQALRHRLKEVEFLERQIAASESRRNKILREIEARREKSEAYRQLIRLAQRAQEMINGQMSQGQRQERVAIEEFAVRKQENNSPLDAGRPRSRVRKRGVTRQNR